jgi:serine O-acetyltransferase
MKDSVQNKKPLDVVEELCRQDSYGPVWHKTNQDVPMLATDVLVEIVEDLRAVLFPGYFGFSDVAPETMHYHIGATLDKIFPLLVEQLQRGICFATEACERDDHVTCERRGREIAELFLESLPQVRHLLSTDVRAAYEGDPAAKDPSETILCYPSIKTQTNYRIAHELHRLGVPLIPRIITEQAHSESGIDIHPGADIGERFFIDHGTGVVIGETCMIGRNVRLYQGVTLGAKSFPLDEHGKPIKGIPRHPVVEDDVIIYSGATILGRVTIGKGSVVGGNVWLTHSVPPGSRVTQSRPFEEQFEAGAGV